MVAHGPVYLAIGIDCEGARQLLGLWIGPTTGESAKFWLTVLSEQDGKDRRRGRDRDQRRKSLALAGDCWCGHDRYAAQAVSVHAARSLAAAM